MHLPVSLGQALGPIRGCGDCGDTPTSREHEKRLLDQERGLLPRRAQLLVGEVCLLTQQEIRQRHREGKIGELGQVPMSLQGVWAFQGGADKRGREHGRLDVPGQAVPLLHAEKANKRTWGCVDRPRQGGWEEWTPTFPRLGVRQGPGSSGGWGRPTSTSADPASSRLPPRAYVSRDSTVSGDFCNLPPSPRRPGAAPPWAAPRSCISVNSRNLCERDPTLGNPRPSRPHDPEFKILYVAVFQLYTNTCGEEVQAQNK